MRIVLSAAFLLVTVATETRPSYEQLLGKSHFKIATEIEQFILKLQELNRLQAQINGEPAPPLADAVAYLDTMGTKEPVRPDNLPYLFEGDIILTDEQIDRKLSEKRAEAVQHSKPKRSLTADLTIRWSSPIAYWIDRSSGVSSSAVEAGIFRWQQLTCIDFQKYSVQPYGIPSLKFTRGEGCYSYVGRSSSFDTQEVSIGHGCTSLGTVTHEIGHALGFFHEQSRPERDDYVTIIFPNIKKYAQSQFTKQSDNSAVNYGVSYDYGSVMHYDGYSFTRTSHKTVVTKDRLYQSTIGQRDEPSFADVKQANFAYCNGTCAHAAPLACRNGGYIDPNRCTQCRCPSGLGGILCDEVQTSLSMSCGDGELTATSHMQEVTVSGDTDCFYRITAPLGRRVFISFTTIDFPAHTPCAQAYAEVKYRANPVPTGARLCGSNRPRSATSEGETMLIIYRGSYATTFSFKYRYNSVDSTIASPLTSTTTAARPMPTPRPSTPYPSTNCVWSACSSNCGGCGTQVMSCNGITTTRMCAMTPCFPNRCCRPFNLVYNNVCTVGYLPDENNAEKPVEAVTTNGIDEEEDKKPSVETSTAVSIHTEAPTTTPYVTPEEELNFIHIQPPESPLFVELSGELIDDHQQHLIREGSGDAAIEAGVSKDQLRARRYSSRRSAVESESRPVEVTLH